MPKIKLTTIIVLIAIISSACGAVTPYPTTTISSPTLTVPRATPLPTLTITPAITPTFENTSTPGTLYGYPTPEPAILPTCNPIDCLEVTPDVQRQDISFHELYVGKYVLRSWCNIDQRFPNLQQCAVTISSKGNAQIEIWGYPAYFAAETGADLTGDGVPDIVIDVWSGAADNGPVTFVYEAGNTLKEIMGVWQDYRGEFIDLNGDGSDEYISPIRNWGSSICIMCQFWAMIVYQYQPKLGYVPETYKFKDVLLPMSDTVKSSLSANIQYELNFLNQFTKQNPKMTLLFSPPNTGISLTPSVEEQEYWQYANENSDYSQAVNALYELAVYYLLAEQPTNAQEILNKYFPPDKASAYMLGIQNDLQNFLAP